MGLFESKEDKSAKEEAKLYEMMAKYGLENLSPEYKEKVKAINQELMGIGMIDAGLKISLAGKPGELCTVSYLNALVQQNWIIIRLLDEIKRK